MKRFIALLLGLLFVLAATTASSQSSIGRRIYGSDGGWQVALSSAKGPGTYVIGTAFPNSLVGFTLGSGLNADLHTCDTQDYSASSCTLATPLVADVTNLAVKASRAYFVLVVNVAETGSNVSYLTIKGSWNAASGGGAGSGPTIAFAPNESSASFGLESQIATLCAGSGGTIDIPAGSYTSDVTALTPATLSLGLVAFPEKCENITIRGQGMNVTKLNWEYDLTDSDQTGGAASTDFRGFVLRGNRWIKFQDIQIAARNVCARDYTYGASEECVSDRRVLIDIDQSTDTTTPSRNVEFSRVHLHFPTTYYNESAEDAGILEWPITFLMLNSEEIHLTDSVVHGQGWNVILDHCESCSVNYNWIGSAFPLSEGPHGVWLDASANHTAPSADQSDAPYSREMQAGIVVGFGEGKEVIGNRIDHTQLPASAMVGFRGQDGIGGQGWKTNGKASIGMAGVLDLTGDVPAHAIVSNNTAYNIMDKSIGCLYLINYNGGLFTGNQCQCASPTGVNCEGGSLIRLIADGGALPSEAYNRENIFIGNRGGVFPTDYPVVAGTEVHPFESCISIYEPLDAYQTSDPTQAAATNVDNSFIGNQCDSGGTDFVYYKPDEAGNATVDVDVEGGQMWGRGNIDLSNGSEYRPGPFGAWTADKTINTASICGGYVTNGTSGDARVITLPPISPRGVSQGCWWKAANFNFVNSNPFTICPAPGQYFAITNSPTSTSKATNECIESTTFQDVVESATVKVVEIPIERTLSQPAIVHQSRMRVYYTETVGSVLLEVGDRVVLSGLVGGPEELNGREFLVAQSVGTAADAYVELTDLNGTDFDSTGFPNWASGGQLAMFAWAEIYVDAGWLSVARP